MRESRGQAVKSKQTKWHKIKFNEKEENRV
jgi:hypothetical protein